MVVKPTVILSLLLAGVLCGCGEVEIARDLQEAEANRILAALATKGVKGSKDKVSSGSKIHYSLAVPRGEAVKAWQVIRQQDLPRRGPGRAARSRSAGGLLASSRQRRAIISRALAADIARTLRSVDGVVDARVHIVRPARRPLAAAEAQAKPRASVLLRSTGISPLSKTQIRKLVSGAVAGLANEDIAVVLLSVSKTSNPTITAPGTKVGPFVVAVGSRGPLLAACTTATLLIMCLGLGILALVRRNRRQDARLQRLTREDELDEEASRDLESSLSLLDRSFSQRRTAPKGTRPAKRSAHSP